MRHPPGSWLFGAALAVAAHAWADEPAPQTAYQPRVAWSGPLEAAPEGLACLDLDRDGDEDAAVVDGRGVLLVNLQDPKAAPLRLPWPAEAPLAPVVRAPHAAVADVPGQGGAAVTIAPSARGGYGHLRAASASGGVPTLTWTMAGTAPLASDGERVLTGLRVAGTHHLAGLKLGDAAVAQVPAAVRAVALLRGPRRGLALAAATSEGVTLVMVQGGRTTAMSHAPGLAAPLAAADVDGDGVDELWSAQDTVAGHDTLLLSRMEQGRLALVRRFAEPGGRVFALARCRATNPERMLVLARGAQEWRVVEVRP